MRCPECTQRNSVAASKCQNCGRKFERKKTPIALIAAIAVVFIGLTVWAVAAAFVPKMSDPSHSLSKAAKRVASGGASPEDAQQIRTEFDKAVIEFLRTYSSLPAPQLTQKLQQELVSNAFEVHVFELPRGLKAVEIDTVLQATGYLSMKTAQGYKVYPITGLDVFDNAQIITEGPPVLVVLGHSSGQAPHHPQLKVFGLLPDDLVDQTEKIVPPLKGEGTASFGKNNKDVQTDISLYSLGVADGLFHPLSGSLPIADETLRINLNWKDNHYNAQGDTGKSPLAALYAVAFAMKNPDRVKEYEKYLGSHGIAVAQQYKLGKGQNGPDFAMVKTAASTNSSSGGSRRRRKHENSGGGSKTVYTLAGTNGTFEIELAPKDAYWVVAQARQTSKVAEKLAQQKLDEQVQVDQAVAEKKITTKSTEDLILQATAPGKNEQNQPQTAPTRQTPAPIETRSGSEDSVTKIIQDKTRDLTAKNKGDGNKGESNKGDNNTKGDNNKIAVAENKGASRDNPRQSDTSSRPVSSDVSPSQNAATTPIESSGEIVTRDRLKIRRGPSTGYRTVSEIPAGAKLEVVGKKDGWYKVRVNGREGYVYGGLVDYNKSNGYTTVTVTNSRAVKDDNQRSVHTPQPGEKMVVLSGVKNNKYKVQLSNGKTGYVDKDAVNVQTEEPPLVP